MARKLAPMMAMLKANMLYDIRAWWSHQPHSEDAHDLKIKAKPLKPKSRGRR